MTQYLIHNCNSRCRRLSDDEYEIPFGGYSCVRAYCQRRRTTEGGLPPIADPGRHWNARRAQCQVALELLRGGDLFDVIVSDIVMPGTDGITMLRQIRRNNLKVPVILITENPSLMTAMSAVQFGGFRYLLNPVPPPDLTKAVARQLKLHRLARLRLSTHAAFTSPRAAG